MDRSGFRRLLVDIRLCPEANMDRLNVTCLAPDVRQYTLIQSCVWTVWMNTMVLILGLTITWRLLMIFREIHMVTSMKANSIMNTGWREGAGDL